MTLTSVPLLLAAAAGVGLAHSILPDHWVPLAVLARANRWSLARTAKVSFLASLGHVGLSLALGVVLATAGLALRRVVVADEGGLVGGVLVLTGLGFLVWALLTRGRGHAHGHSHDHAHAHSHGGDHAHDPAHPHSHPHTEGHGPGQGSGEDRPQHLHGGASEVRAHASDSAPGQGHDPHHHHGPDFDHGHGPDHDHEQHQHQHGHEHGHGAPEGGAGPGPRRAAWLAEIAVPFGVAASPDLTILPVFLAASAVGVTAAVGTLVTFTLATVGAFVVLTVAATVGGYQVRWPWLDRNGHLVSALVLLVVGVLVLAGV